MVFQQIALYHPGGNPGANLKSISHTYYLREVAFELELTTEAIYLPLVCLQGGSPAQNGNNLEVVKDLSHENCLSQGWNLALTVLFVPPTPNLEPSTLDPGPTPGHEWKFQIQKSDSNSVSGFPGKSWDEKRTKRCVSPGHAH